MALQIDELLHEHDLTRYDVSQVSGILESTLSYANRKDINGLSVKTIRALAMALAMTPGEVLDSLLKFEGNPIINFIDAHPFMDKKLVKEVENAMIDAHEHGIEIKSTTFNRYYEEGTDTNERAETALRELLEMWDQHKAEFTE